MKKKVIIIVGIVLVLILLIVGKKSGWWGNQPKGKEVEVKQITRNSLTQKVSATGKIQPELEIKISSEVSGEIIELPVVEGQMVKKGDLLVRINPDIYQSVLNRSVASLENIKSSLRQAEANFKENEASFERNQKLFEKGVISRAEWDKAVSAYDIAKANKESAKYSVQSAMASVSEAQDNLKRTSIYAPASGTISKLNVELGERVVGTVQMTGTEIMRVANLSSMEVEVDVNESDIVKVNINDRATIEVDAYPKKNFEGRVTNIANTANATASVEQVTNFKVKIHIDEASYQALLTGKKQGYSPFRPGMTATVDILTTERNDVVTVPVSAIVMKSIKEISKDSLIKEKDDKRQEAVFVVKDGKALLKAVSTGIQDNTDIEILSGVEAGEQIIVGPYNLVSRILKSGDEVRVKVIDEKSENK
ncbi:efflux RND transporter periplasmic adaptor subunit [Capnocytophaga canimorsus]|uniref:Efflux transporter periplasmic adaptor subunit n=1 Tax=Capnocytophaga canimorsus TaxID=28188 RepID=A0AAC9Z5N9_9FLAO|nr:efflux RND transporter periplasmic adaptor subunit [Capnocytophaga canimorsus]ATA94157.1 efflux transporter periplasmic adaptor subunit [Capnocytophaga canimorsus]AWL78885.1 efflux RND transporter periplasmic adaptor subunit [Capnocytophaga canimorsus]AYW37490.1 efflux RND transporter periplasmic adaptor subunit [Capnocytophaga canimorsus]MDT9500282.1 efflux RND transporter periplasmic adaptor subunit [Capnocytophaga canimorsus]GIM57739.1 RND transporter [Capnocytophaga canimorsus]